MPNLIPLRRHDITFHRGGLIEITARIAAQLQLSPGDAINVFHDNGEYMLFSTRGNGRRLAQCYPAKKGSRYFRCSCALMTSAILALCGNPRRASFYCGAPMRDQAGRTLIPIITHNPIIP